MAGLHKIIGLTKDIGRLCGKILASSSNCPAARSVPPTTHISSAFGTTFLTQIQPIHTTTRPMQLMDFFEDKKNLGENEVKSGRAWNKDELRIKSNSDLHKLWFVLLKERNMLLTMEHECKRQMELFPSPERIDKVKVSMQNLEHVVRERNRAYHLLETGDKGERPGQFVNNQLGMKFFYRSCEHIMPKLFNRKWNELHNFRYGGSAVRKFLKFYREKQYNEKRKRRNRDANHVKNLLKRNPELSKDLLKQQYPSVDVDKLVRTNQIRGHYPPPE